MHNEPAISEAKATSDMDASILIVDDDSSVIQVMGHILSGVGKLRFATNGEDALLILRDFVPDLILLDAQMSGMSGFQLFETLKKDSALADVPVIFVTSHSEPDFEISALEMGAVDFIAKPFRSALVRARVRTHLRMKHLADNLRRIASTDVVTGVANQPRFDELLEREWRRTRRGGEPISLLMVDLDDFRSYNDRYGHSKGNDCLRRVAEVLVSACRRPADLVARCGGGEFMVLLPQTSRIGAEQTARRVLQAVEALCLSHEDSPKKLVVTVSVGIACYDKVSACWTNSGPEIRLGSDSYLPCAASDLVLAADKALKAAKRAGRGQVTLRDISGVDRPEPAQSSPARSVPQTPQRHEHTSR